MKKKRDFWPLAKDFSQRFPHKISSLQATKESVGVLGIAFGKKSLEEILIKILLTQEIKKGDRMKKKRDFWPKAILNKDFHIRFLAMGNTKRSRLSRSDDFRA